MTIRRQHAKARLGERREDAVPQAPRAGKAVHVGARILVVDDDDDIRLSLNLVLRSAGYTPVEAVNGAEALSCASKEPLALVILDLVMPVMDGWQFLEQWKRDPRFANVPVVVLSAHGALPDQPPQGAVAALRKPFDLEVLLYVIKQHLKAEEDRSVTT